jgi:putative phosphonate transport system ATP-binding protein
MNDAIMRVCGLTKLYGGGCVECQDNTGPEHDTNVCPVCGTVTAISDVSFELIRGEILGVVGESGSGKSTLLQAIYFDTEATSGAVYLEDYAAGEVDILSVQRNRKRFIRNHSMGMVYQNPMMGLRLKISSGGNIAEKLLDADTYNFKRIRARAGELLTETEIPLAYLDTPPARLSGGMQQRVQISKALANNPPILLLDEVTSGLDVSVQARVLDMVKGLQDELGITIIVVSHDMGVIRLLADRTVVMKNGRVVESGLTDQILDDPQEAYTQLLVHSTL